MLITLPAPTPTIAPKAAVRFMKGSVVASPLMASAPTPLPIKKRSAMFKTLDAVMAMMAGMAYLNNRLEIRSVPSSVMFFCSICDAKLRFYFTGGKNVCKEVFFIKYKAYICAQ